MKTIRALLSGGELFGVGARAAGYTHIDGYEIDPRIAAVARLNGFDVHTADICDVDYSSLPAADHLHASTVCTRASQANVGAVETEADLRMAAAVCRAIACHQGSTFTLENVWAYRTFESFDRILAALKACGFVSDYRHVNAADYGVPQTRKRLILRAVRGRERVPPLHPTHRHGGDMFHPPWVGWYAAIADILHTLPETKPAPWQLARMPKELRDSVLIGNNNQEWGDGIVYGEEPAFSVTQQSHGRSRAFLLGDQRAGSSDGVQVRGADEPALTVRSLGVSGGSAARAFLINGQNARSTERGGLSIQAADEPAFTVAASGKGVPRAWLDETARNAIQDRATGRWVRMTIQALGRFQTVPDDYQGLTAQINGNGVPCLLSQRIMESLL